MTLEQRVKDFLEREGYSPEIAKHKRELIWCMRYFADQETADLQERLAEAEKVIDHYSERGRWNCGPCAENGRLHDGNHQAFIYLGVNGYEQAANYRTKYPKEQTP